MSPSIYQIPIGIRGEPELYAITGYFDQSQRASAYVVVLNKSMQLGASSSSRLQLAGTKRTTRTRENGRERKRERERERERGRARNSRTRKSRLPSLGSLIVVHVTSRTGFTYSMRSRYRSLLPMHYATCTTEVSGNKQTLRQRQFFS